MNAKSNQINPIDLESCIFLELKNKDERTVKTVTTLSADTVKRRYPDKVRQLSDRRQGMKLKDALAIAEGQD